MNTNCRNFLDKKENERQKKNELLLLQRRSDQTKFTEIEGWNLGGQIQKSLNSF